MTTLKEKRKCSNCGCSEYIFKYSKQAGAVVVLCAKCEERIL